MFKFSTFIISFCYLRLGSITTRSYQQLVIILLLNVFLFFLLAIEKLCILQPLLLIINLQICR